MEKVKFKAKEILSKGWSELAHYTYEYFNEKGHWETQVREAYDRGNGTVVILYNPQSKKVILTRQFRLPTYLNGNKTGLMIEACAGKLENENPEQGMMREIEEETGYRVPEIKKVFEVYMSPGSVTELLHFYIGEYNEAMKKSAGGGLDTEQENIEVLELAYVEAMSMITNGQIKDAKTIMLLQYLGLSKLME